MGERESLLAAVCADPGNDLPRLVYADWLEENGDPHRARFIRAQVEADQYIDGDSRKDDLNRLAERLQRGRVTAWRGPLPAGRGANWGRLHRGFVSDLVVAFPAEADSIAEQVRGRLPLGGAVLDLSPAYLHRREVENVRPGEAPWLRAVRRVSVRWLLPTAAICRWLDREDLPPLDEYHSPINEYSLRVFHNGLSESTILGHEKVTAVRRLRLDVNGQFRGQTFGGDNPLHFPRLRDFEMRSAGPSIWPDIDLGPLYRLPWVSGLRRLSVATRSPQVRTPAGVVDAERPNLTTFAYRGKGLDRAGLIRLVEAPTLPALTELILPRCGLGPRAADVLTQTGVLGRLTVLDLTENALNAAAAEKLAAARPASLARLVLRGNPVADRVKRRLRQQGVVI